MNVKKEVLTRWTTENAAELYGIHSWGYNYFDIAPDGKVVVVANKANGRTRVSLLDIVEAAKSKDVSMPLLLRFSHIISSQLRLINEGFRKAMADAGYQGQYRGVYPIKVNQERDVVEAIVTYGRPFHHGLEAGSKAELIAAVAHMSDPEAMIICNGYKDEEFIDLALHARKIGLQTIIIVEMPDEMHLILDRAAQLGVRPLLGVRAKLSSKGGGHWDSSGGDRSKFGLDATQVVEAIDLLREKGMLDCMRLLHYHLGSQISDIRKIRTALQEACRFYAELVKEGAPMGVINIGGGLAVDYDGSHTNFASSSNYAIEEYAADVVEVVMNTLNSANVAHPTIVSESGRATVAHHSVLVFNILDTRRLEPRVVPANIPSESNELLKELMYVSNSLSPRNVQEAYHDAVYYRDEIRFMFLHGRASLRDRATAETIFWHIVQRISGYLQDQKYVPDELEGLDVALADVYYGNFSLFQSMPDSWAIDQLFPVMPLHRLNEMPTRQATLADITCDSDGKVDRFIDLHDVKHSLLLHEPDGNEYYLGVFLVGAYQETLGDAHNLFGDTNVMHVRIGDDGTVEYAAEIAGDSVKEVLSYVDYMPELMLERIKTTAHLAVQAGKITPHEEDAALQAYKLGLSGYTYFEK